MLDNFWAKPVIVYGDNCMKKITIAVDGHWLVCRPRSGISSYLRALLTGWSHCADEMVVQVLVPYGPDPTRLENRLFDNPRFQIVVANPQCNPITAYRHQIWWQQCTIPALLRKCRPDVYLSPFHLTPQLPLNIKMVTTIHDLVFFKEPVFSLGWSVHVAQLMSACLRARRLICVSQFTLDDFSRRLPLFAKKARVVHNGIEAHTLSPMEAQERVVRLCPELAEQGYLIWVGIPCARKNIRLLFKVFAAHHRQFPTHHFVILSPLEYHDQMRLFAREQGIETTLRLFADVDNPTRDALYRRALALIFPSSFEGFGYPVLEAMYQGCPSFSLRGTVMQELLNGVMPMVEEPTSASFIQALQPYVAMSRNEREALSENLLTRAGEFSSDAMAKKTLAVIREAIG